MIAATRPWLGLLLAAAVLAAGGRAEAELSAGQRQQLLAEAQDAYDRGISLQRSDARAAGEAFDQAARRFQQLLDDGIVSGSLHYNLANAYLQGGELGRAILHYRAAAKLMPGDPEVEHNLEFARSLRRSRIAPSGQRALAAALLGWHGATPVRARFTVFLAAYLAFWAILCISRLVPGVWWRWAAAVTAAAWLAAGASVAVDLLVESREGVVLRDDVVVRKGNGEGFERQFAEPLHQGVEFRVVEQRADWLSIELPDGKTGWIRAETAGIIG